MPGDPATAPSTANGDAAPGAETKACPFCGETVLKSAKKCKHCREILSPALRAARESAGAASGSKVGRDALIFGILGIAVCGLFGIAAIIKGREAQKVPDQAGMGMAGIVLGILSCLMMLLVVGIGIFAVVAGN